MLEPLAWEGAGPEDARPVSRNCTPRSTCFLRSAPPHSIQWGCPSVKTTIVSMKRAAAASIERTTNAVRIGSVRGFDYSDGKTYELCVLRARAE